MNFVKVAWERIVLSYKSTLVGLGAGIAIILLDGFTDYLNGLPQGWAKVLSGLVVLIGASLKSKALPPTPAGP